MKNKRIHTLIGFPVMLFYIFVSSSIGYFITNLIFKIANQKMSYANSIITSYITFTVFIVMAITIFSIFRLKHLGNQNILLSNVIAALEKISQGDFDVFLELNEDYKHDDHGESFYDIIQSINKMAKELGSMEMLRQDFISNVSHEIGSPLTSIKGFAILLRDSKLSEKDRNHYIDIIETETTRLSKLSENFLKLANLEDKDNPLNLTEFRLDKQIENVVLMLEPQWREKKQEIKLNLEVVMINADKDLLYEVWVNIIGNSVKFTDNNGVIEITLKNDNEQINCKIADNGIGIDVKDKMHIFERFYKADKSRTRAKAGNGLGLSLVKKIVELHNGKILVESEVGKGTKFTVYFNK